MTCVYSDVDHRIELYNGDCQELLRMGLTQWQSQGLQIAIITDPPYGIGKDKLWTGGGRSHKGGEHRANLYNTDMVGNDRPYDPRWILELNVPTLLFGANHFSDLLPRQPGWIVWDKMNSILPGRPPILNDQADCELAWTNFGNPARLMVHQWRGIVRDSERDEPRIHPTQKPVALLRWIIKTFLKPDTVILDPYAGSCSTLVAAKELGRPAIGIEIDPEMCAKAIPRLRKEYLIQLDTPPTPDFEDRPLF